MSDFTADQAAVVRIERAEEGRWDLTIVSDSGVPMGHGVHLFDRTQDDGIDELAAAADFVGGYGFRFDGEAVQPDGPDAYWAPLFRS
jgi:hypothetical protein